MSEQEAKTTGSAEAQPAAQSVDFKANLGKIPLVEKTLAIIALAVVLGWFITWGAGSWDYIGLFKSWFATLSFFGALAVAALVLLKLFGMRPLSPELEKKAISIASLLPVIGYLISIISPVSTFLTIGGSIALAYLSATTYWRKHIPEFATRPLGAGATGESAAGTS